MLGTMQPSVVHLDFETKSKADLRAKGSHKYSADPSTALWCGAFGFDDEAIQIWRPGEPDPVRLLDHVRGDGIVVAHNAAFELDVWHYQLEQKLGWPRLHIEQTRCTMAMALALGLPASLDGASKAVQLPIKKDKDGAYLMRRMCVADDKVWPEEDIQRLIDYCIQDVKVERELEKRLQALSKSEQAIWSLDQKINRRGVPVDIPTIQNAIELADDEKVRLNEKMQKLNGLKASQVLALSDWVAEQGY